MDTSTIDGYAKQVTAYMGLDGTQHDDFITDCVHTGVQLITAHCDGNGVPVDRIPRPVFDRAVVEVAAELYNRKSAPLGIKNFGDLDGGTTPVRIARDPMTAARPLLSPYLPLGTS